MGGVTNLLDGSASIYDTCQTRIYGCVSPPPALGSCADKRGYLFYRGARSRRRLETNGAVTDGSNACVTLIKLYAELREEGFRQGPTVALKESPPLEAEAWESGPAAVLHRACLLGGGVVAEPRLGLRKKATHQYL